MELREISEEEYNAFIHSYPLSSIYQTSEYAAVMTEQGYKYLFLGYFNNNAIVSASLILIQKINGYNYAFCPRGFLIDYNNKELLSAFTKDVKKFLNKLDVVAIKISPMLIKDIIDNKKTIVGNNPKFDDAFANLKNLGYYHFGFNKGFESSKPRFEALLDITKDYRIIFSNIKKEYRTKIRSAEKQGIKIYRSSDNEINLMYDQTKEKYPRNIKYFEDSYKYFNSDGKNKMDYYYAKIDTKQYLKVTQDEYYYQERMVLSLNDLVLKNKDNSNKLITQKLEADKQLALYKEKLVNATNLLKSFPNGVVLASALIIKNRDEIFLYMDGYDIKYKNFNAKHLIIWKIIEKYAKEGYKRFNFGGLPDPRDDNSKFKGLTQFKMNFNACAIEYAGDFELVVNSLKYAFYRKMKKM